MKANREEGEVEEGRCCLEGFLEEVRLKRKVRRIWMGGESWQAFWVVLMSQITTNQLLLTFVEHLFFS